VTKRRLLGEQTIEPTAVAGFNQFFDDFNGTESRTMGIGLDYALSRSVYAGAELSSRKLTVPQSFTQFAYPWYEESDRAYLYWIANSSLVLTADYSYERFDRSAEFVGTESFTTVVTQRVPLGLTWYPLRDRRWSTKLVGEYVDQRGDFFSAAGAPFQGSDRFWIADAAIAYQFPGRRGWVSFQAQNLFNREFHFQETNFATPTLARGRLMLMKVAFQL
jgi:hypothetical protein